MQHRYRFVASAEFHTKYHIKKDDTSGIISMTPRRTEPDPELDSAEPCFEYRNVEMKDIYTHVAIFDVGRKLDWVFDGNWSPLKEDYQKRFFCSEATARRLRLRRDTGTLHQGPLPMLGTLA